jgi:ubiquinone/menaquinone biosynthesis C-methylase UbiE
MDSIQSYLKMQKDHYYKEANRWSLENKNPVVGGYEKHNKWKDYDEYLFKDFITNDLIALDYGTGPGRNIIKFRSRFKRIDGVDIGEKNIENAAINLKNSGIEDSNLYVCDGKSIPTESEIYDVVFSVICFQHIACYDVRYSIFEEVYRVLKHGGYFCFQMGYGGRDENNSNYKTYTKNNKLFTADYYENATSAKTTNGFYDVSVTDPNQLKTDLLKIGFTDFKYDIRPTGPGDTHRNWIFVEAKK